MTRTTKPTSGFDATRLPQRPQNAKRGKAHGFEASHPSMQQRISMLSASLLVATAVATRLVPVATTHLEVSQAIPHAAANVDSPKVGSSTPRPSAVLRSRDQQPSGHQHHRELIFSPIFSFFDFIRSIVNMVLSFLGLPTFGSDQDTPSSSPPMDPNQYTPNPADWSTFYSTVDNSMDVTDHTPDGISWLSSSAWVPWDGTTIYDPTAMSHNDFTTAICPTGDTIRGLREVFYDTNPFADPEQPTKAEVDYWHGVALTHLRKLVGIDLPAVPDHCLFARALWGQEIRLSTQWDNDYPGDSCVGSGNPHCGHSFLPSAQDQVPYLPAGHPTCGLGAGAEGVSNAAKVDIPWSIKWVRVFCSYLNSEGYNGGHVGPYFRREKFGWSFWDPDQSNSNGNANFRGKWSGQLITPPWAL